MVSVGKRLRLDHLAEPHIEFPFDHAELALDDIGINVLGLYPVEVTTRCDIAWFGLEAPPLLARTTRAALKSRGIIRLHEIDRRTPRSSRQ